MSSLNYGPVKVIGGIYKGRRGIYDDDDHGRAKLSAIVYLEGFDSWVYIKPENLVNLDLNDQEEGQLTADSIIYSIKKSAQRTKNV